MNNTESNTPKDTDALPQVFSQALRYLKEKRIDMAKESITNGVKMLEMVLDNESNQGIFKRINHSSQDLDSEVNFYLDSVFHPKELPPNSMKKLQKKTASFILFKQIYQLSHIHGILQHSIKAKKEIGINQKRYFDSKFCLDCIETFAELFGILLEFKDPNTKLRQSNYDYLKAFKKLRELPNSALSKMKTQKTISNYRNLIAHGQMFFFENKLYSRSRENDQVRKESPQEFLNLAGLIWSLLIYYTTSLDILILKQFIQGKVKFEGAWREYFENYVNGFNELTKMES
jgi:hypothetical protein